MTTFESFIRVIPYTDANGKRGFCVSAECNGRRMRQFTADPRTLLAAMGDKVQAVSQKGQAYIRSKRPCLVQADVSALGRMSIHAVSPVAAQEIEASQEAVDAFEAALKAAEPAKQSQPQTAAAAPMTSIVL